MSVLREKQSKVVSLIRSKLAKSVSGTFGLKVSLIALTFLTSIILARLLGTEGYGIYTYCIAWVRLLQVPAGLGARLILSREVSAYRAKSQWGLLKGLLEWINKSVLLSSVSITLVVAIGVFLWSGKSLSASMVSFYLALAALPFLTLTAVRQGTMQGLRAIVLGQLPENLIQPILMIASVGVAYLFLGSYLTAPWVMAIKSVSIIFAFLTGVIFLGKVLPKELRHARARYEVSKWTRSILPFLLISCTHIINNRTDVLMLGALDSTESSGIYTVATRGANLITFVLVAVNMSLGPVISGLYANGNLEKLQQTVKKSTRVIFFGSLPIALGLILFNKWFLLLFGAKFLQGSTALMILCVGQMVNASVGSVGVILDMTGHERYSAMGIGLSAFLNIILNAVLIPKYGLEGAAISTASSIICWNIFLFICVRKKLGINSTILG